MIERTKEKEVLILDESGKEVKPATVTKQDPT